MLQDLRNVTFTGLQVSITENCPQAPRQMLACENKQLLGGLGRKAGNRPVCRKNVEAIYIDSDTLTVGFSPRSEQGASESFCYQNANSTPSTTASTSEQLIIEPESLFESKTSECLSFFLSKGNFLQVSDVELVMSHQLCQTLQPLGN